MNYTLIYKIFKAIKTGQTNSPWIAEFIYAKVNKNYVTFSRAKEVINKHANMIILDREVLKSKYQNRLGGD